MFKPRDCDLWRLIQLFPEKDWNWCAISANPGITDDMKRDNPGYPWKKHTEKCKDCIMVQGLLNEYSADRSLKLTWEHIH